jgi:hypothetical protein
VNADREFRVQPRIEIGDELRSKVPAVVWPALFKLVQQMVFGNARKIDCVAAKIEEVIRDQDKSPLQVRIRRITVDASLKTAVNAVTSKGHLLCYSHRIDQASVSGCLGPFAAGPGNPISYRSHFNEIPPSGMAELAVGERTEAARGIGCKPFVVVDYVRE